MIRLYRDSDFSDVFFLQKVSYEFPCTENELREKLSSGKAWVEEPDPAVQAVTGCVVCCSENGRDIIWSLTVSPAFRKRGIAWNLLSEAEDNYPELWLHTDPTGPAMGLYLRRGYKVVQEEPNFYGPSRPGVLMVKINGHN